MMSFLKFLTFSSPILLTPVLCSCLNVSTSKKEKIISQFVDNKYVYKVITTSKQLAELVQINETLISTGLANVVEKDPRNYILFENTNENKCIYFRYPKLLYDKFLSTISYPAKRFSHIYKGSYVRKLTHNFLYYYYIRNKTLTNNEIMVDFNIKFSEKSNKAKILISCLYFEMVNGEKTRVKLEDSPIILQRYKIE